MRCRSLVIGASLLAAVLSGLLGSCSCGPNFRYAAFTTIEEQGVKITVGVAAVVSTGVTRNGILTTQRYEIAVAYPGRDTIKISNYIDKDVLSHEALKKRIKDLKLRISPDRKHFALAPGPFGKRIHFYHLLPKGQPFRWEKFDEQHKVKRLSELDWKQVPPPLEIARQSMRDRIGPSSEFCIDSDLGVTLNQNIKSRSVVELVLEVWPDCKDAHWEVAQLVKPKATPGYLLVLLRKRMDAYLDQPKPSPNGLPGIVSICRIVGDKQRLKRAYRAALPHWPADYDIHSKVFDTPAALPDDVKKLLAERAKKILADPKSSEYEKKLAKEVLGDVT